MSTSGRADPSKQAAGHLHAISSFQRGSKPKSQNGVLNLKCEVDPERAADIVTQNQDGKSHHQTFICTVSGY